MKKRELERKLNDLGWYSTGDGSKHEKWTNGEQVTMVPRHKEINEWTARGILKFAKANPPKKN